MKLPSALALAARQMDMPAAQLQGIWRTLANQQPAATTAQTLAATTGPDDTAGDCGDEDEQARSLNFSLLASHSLLTRTINLLK
jgi:hypothetical protein